MRDLSRFFRFVFFGRKRRRAACALARPASCAGPQVSARPPRLGGFHDYVLALSWSPTYCDTHGEGERGGRGRYRDRDRGGHGGYGGYGRYRFYDRRDDDDSRTTAGAAIADRPGRCRRAVP